MEVISSLNYELKFKSDVGRKQKMSDLEVVALSLTAEFMTLDSVFFFNRLTPMKFLI